MSTQAQKELFLLKNPIKEYNWGDPNILPTLLGYENLNAIPQAELWMGAHPNSPSTLEHDGKTISLTDLLAKDAMNLLGPHYGTSLPFLFKILAIQTPLSLQVHPAKALAEAGFQQENKQAIPLSHPKRTYKDDNDKTELLYAYSQDVWALVGFRTYQESINDLQAIPSAQLQQLLTPFSSQPNATTLKEFLVSLLTSNHEDKRQIIHDTLHYLDGLKHLDDRCQWVKKLHQHYPSDIAILAPFYMNLLHLPKGQSVFVASGTLHAYLQGTGIEVMAASDNVVRFGLTEKYVDLESLSHVVSFESQAPLIIPPAKQHMSLLTPACSFKLQHLADTHTQPYALPTNNPPQIALALQADALLHNSTLNLSYHLHKGQSIFIPYSAGNYTMSSKGEIFIASAYE